MAARRGLNGSGGPAAVRAWLRRLATGKWLSLPRPGRRGPSRPAAEGREIPSPEPAGTTDFPWLEPYPDDLLSDLPNVAAGPDARYGARESVSLAFVTALQHVPPRQRAALVLCDVLGFGDTEAAEILDCGTEAFDRMLRQARAEIAARLPPGLRDRAPLPGSAPEREVAGRFADAFERGDVDGLAALLTDDAWLAVPPLPGRYQGRAAAEVLAKAQLRDGTRRFRLIPTRANGQPAFGCYRCDPVTSVAHAHGLIVLTLDGDRVSGITRFTDNSVLHRFGLPRTLPD